MNPIRAGGHVIGEHGWELDHPPPAAAAAEKSEQPAAAQPDKRDCPDCGKPVPVNKNGTLRKHVCEIEAPPPQVTFNEEEDEDEEVMDDG